MVRALAGLLALLGAQAAAAAPGAAPEARVYAEGQAWDYRTRPQDAGSLLRIQRIEDHPGYGRIYHVSVVGVRFAGRGEATVISHLPVSRATLDASVTRLARRAADFPDADEGIAMWREAQGGVFDVPLSEIVGFAEAAMQQTPVARK